MQAQTLNVRWILGPVPAPAPGRVPGPVPAPDPRGVKEETRVPKEVVPEKDKRMDQCTRDQSHPCIKDQKFRHLNK